MLPLSSSPTLAACFAAASASAEFEIENVFENPGRKGGSRGEGVLFSSCKLRGTEPVCTFVAPLPPLPPLSSLPLSNKLPMETSEIGLEGLLTLVRLFGVRMTVAEADVAAVAAWEDPGDSWDREDLTLVAEGVLVLLLLVLVWGVKRLGIPGGWPRGDGNVGSWWKFRRNFSSASWSACDMGTWWVVGGGMGGWEPSTPSRF